MKKSFCFTVDDNIRFFRELTEQPFESIFDHPYLGMYKHLHEKYGLKVQMNLFFEDQYFDLTKMTDRYKEEWRRNSNWLKLSFHSRRETNNPYVASKYDEVFEDCKKTHQEIIRFASKDALGKTTTIHFCTVTDEGIMALRDNGVQGLLGLYGDEEHPRGSYKNTLDECDTLRKGELVLRDGVTYGGIDIVLNRYSKEKIEEQLTELFHRNFIKVMIHEQYFYEDYHWYQKDFEAKLDHTFNLLLKNEFCSIFFEERIKKTCEFSKGE